MLNGLVMCDYDHVENPHEKFEEIKKGFDLKQLGICLFFITPGGEGLKSVSIADINYNLTDNQQQLAKQFGLTAKIDKGTKDSSRLSYIPKWDDILYIDEEILFNYDNPLYDEKYGKQYREGNSQGKLDFAEDKAGKDDQEAELTVDLTAINLDENEEGTYCYHGVPYTDILKKWLELKGGTPSIGDRHDRMLSLSGELRRIVNNKPANVLWLMKQADFYEDFVKELKNDKKLFEEFVNHLTINVSEFYRNTDQWELLDKTFIPEMIGKYGKRLKIWSAACSTGDEP